MIKRAGNSKIAVLKDKATACRHEFDKIRVSAKGAESPQAPLQEVDNSLSVNSTRRRNRDWSPARKTPLPNPPQLDADTGYFFLCQARFMLHAGVNGFLPAPESDDMEMIVNKMPTSGRGIPQGYSVDTNQYAKVGRHCLHQACDDHSLT